jgi:predicted lipase
MANVKALIAAHPSAKIVVTGHSLGAAVATFAALDIKTKLIPKTRLFSTHLNHPEQETKDSVTIL